jgi:hypothetical protein
VHKLWKDFSAVKIQSSLLDYVYSSPFYIDNMATVFVDQILRFNIYMYTRKTLKMADVGTM